MKSARRRMDIRSKHDGSYQVAGEIMVWIIYIISLILITIGWKPKELKRAERRKKLKVDKKLL